MYGYVNEVPLNMSETLSKYSQEDIFKIVFKEYPDLDILYLSPFRVDHHPNCFFEWYKGKLLFRDFGDIRRDCFQSIRDFYKIDTYPEVIEFIVRYFEKNPISVDQRPINVFHREKRDCAITYKLKPYENQDDLFWKQFCITPQQLDEDGVYVINWYRFYSDKRKTWISVRPYDICYAITGFESRCKIYRPLNHNKKSKWLTNCKPNDIGNLSKIDATGDLLIITKSYKDFRVIKNQGYKNVIWFQSEKIVPDDIFLSDLAARFTTIVIFYDNDEAGKTGAENLQLHFSLLNKTTQLIFSPYPHMKDPAEIVSIRGEQELKDILNSNISGISNSYS